MDINDIQENDTLVLELGAIGYGVERITATVKEVDLEDGHDKAIKLWVNTGNDHRDYTLWLYEVKGQWIHGYAETPVKFITLN